MTAWFVPWRKHWPVSLEDRAGRRYILTLREARQLREGLSYALAAYNRSRRREKT